MKLKLIQGSKTTSQQGFSLLETMIASMISLIFMSLGANLVLAANIQKIVAKRNITMNNFIQSDLEGIKYQANILARTGIDPMNPTNLTPIDYCTATNPESRLAGALKAKLASNTSTNIKILKHDYTMTRTLGAISTSDPNILPISYIFTRAEATADSPPEHQIYIEIIPNAAFECPATP